MYDILVTCHIFFIHFLVHLGYFHFLAIVNSSAMNTRMLIYLWNHYFNILDKYSEAGLLDHIFNFYIVKSYHTIFTVSAWFYIPTNSIKGFQFSINLMTLIFGFGFRWLSSWQVGFDLIVVLIFLFLMISDIEYVFLLFIYLFAICISEKI